MKSLRLLSLFLSLVLLFAALSVPALAADPSEKNKTVNDLWMKVGCPRALDREKKVPCDTEAPDAAPYTMGDTVYFPLRAAVVHIHGDMNATETGVTVTYYDGSTLATLDFSGEEAAPVVLRDGVVYIELSYAAKIFDLNSYYSPLMGMLALSSTGLHYADTLEDQKLIYSLAKQFVFDFPTGKEVLTSVKNGVGLETHPRLAVSQDRFDLMRDVYDGKVGGKGYDDLRAWIAEFVAQAEERYDALFADRGNGTDWKSEEVRLESRAPNYCYDEFGNAILPDRDLDNLFTRGDIPDRYLNDPIRTYTYDPETHEAVYTVYKNEMKSEEEIVYQSRCEFGDGYDVGARNNFAPAFSNNVIAFAFAWQMTGEQKYADAFRLATLMLCSWPDWGESHFLNVADTSIYVSLGLDWIWHAFDDEPQVREEIADGLYAHVVRPAYYQSYEYGQGNSGAANSRVGAHTRVARINPGGAFYFYRATNWNFVCTSGAVLACLAILEFEKYRTPEMIADYECADTLTAAEWNLPNLANALVEYVPDGAYSEGPGYWGYATLSFYWMIAGLLTSTGDTYGLMNSIGMDRTCNYIYNIGDAAGEVWAYHDCPKGTGATYCLFFASNFYDNPDYTVYRYSAIKAGCALHYLDICFFDPAMLASSAEASKVYYMEASDVVTMRAGWEPDDAFTGLHGGPNNGDHTDADAGIFILDMGGVRWIDDGGNENYNVGDYFGPTRFYYFRKSVEAHPTLFLISNAADVREHGQVINTFADPYAKITRIEENEHGSVASVDMTPQFGKVCDEARRTVMINADGKSVVVQDHIKINDPETEFVWNLPIHTEDITVKVASDAKSATLSKDGLTLRATLLSENRKLTFRYAEAGEDPLLPTTISQNSLANFDTTGQKRYELASDTCGRLYIRSSALLGTYDLAVVFELIEDGSEPVCYKLTEIDKMTPLPLSTYEKSKPDDPGEVFVDDSDVLPADLLAAVAAMPEYGKENVLAFAEAVQHLYALEAALNPENPDTGAARRAMKDYLSDLSDAIDEINETILKIERVRKKSLAIPLG